VGPFSRRGRGKGAGGRPEGDISKAEYSSRAIHFRDAPIGRDIEQFVFSSGIIFKYNTKTNEFMIHKPNGEITTYLIPTNPIKYWATQKEQYEN